MQVRKVKGFTLVELLVVIAIIGILVALLLPAVQAAREAARRTDCRNRMRQIGLAVLNMESSLGVFPTGGDTYWPRIEDYVAGGAPNGPSRQGLGWAFQILPYLEGGAVHSLTTSEEIQQTVIGGYFCPSRRASVVSTTENGTAALSDYAGATPCTCVQANCTTRFDPTESVPLTNGGLFRNYLSFYPGNQQFPPDDVPWDGVFVRTPWRVSTQTVPRGVPNPTRAAKITDGLSKTLMIGEKYVRSDLYEGGPFADDRGWSDGWDFDSMRSTCFQPLGDGDPRGFANPEWYGSNEPGNGFEARVLFFGAAHPGGFNGGFADNSVRTISFDVDIELFNALGTRNGGEIVDESAL